MSEERDSIGLRKAEERSAVRSLIERVHDAWARGDSKAYAACFAENSDYITFNGLLLRGRIENAELHGALFQGVLKGTKLSAEIECLDLLSNEVALVRTANERKNSYQTYVLVKNEAGWLIRSFQNTRVRPFSTWMTRWLQKKAVKGEPVPPLS
jgi:uncharacterized protein (TIGR02246 family)